MVDRFGRRVDYLRLSVTDLCNYRCRYCMPAEGVRKRSHGDILRVEECLEIVRAAAACGVRKARVTGGRGTVGLIEPMSHPFCGNCGRIRVTADGRLKPCLHSREEIPLRGLRGRALEEAIRRGILQKPEGHHLTQRPSDTPRAMNQIGG